MLPSSLYHRIFQQDKDGKSILDELTVIYYDRSSYAQGDPYHTAYKEGQREVIAHILRRCAMIDEVEDGNTSAAD
jgi:hypothetical protein